MFDDFKEYLKGLFTSRLTILMAAFLMLGGILLYRCFNLQIVNGERYLENFKLETEKVRDIKATRGNIYDRNGNVLAYNELAYSVKIEDVFESGRQKNKKLNDVIYTLIQLIEKNGDGCITDFKIVLNEDNKYEYSVADTQLLRFLADVYGHTTIDQLKPAEKSATPDEVMEYLCGSGRFAIGEYENPEDEKSEFVPGKGYTKSEVLKLVNIRYAMNLTSYRKYIGTTVATDISRKTVAVIMENSDILPGVSIEEDTMRRYVDSMYFAHVLGYTGKISSEELTSLNEQLYEKNGASDTYNINDVVGKSGIESYMETTLQGTKGNEKVVVDNTGKVITVLESTQALSGDDVYLTIDRNLTIAIYNIIEQKLAGMLSAKVINAKTYDATASTSSKIMIPIYDVYFSIINNNIADMNRFDDADAGENEKAVYEVYQGYRDNVYETVRQELTDKKTPYNKLSKEYQVYESNIVTLLSKNGILKTSVIDTNDPTYTAWTYDEVISLAEYLKYCIAQNWIEVSQLELSGKYSDSDEIYDRLVDEIIVLMDGNSEFQRRFYKYMLLNDRISPRQICSILIEQDSVDIPDDEKNAFISGRITPYQLMKDCIDNIWITPAQFALDPCNASVVLTDVNTGDVLAIVTYPGYDNNKMANSIDAAYFERLRNDKSSPQLNFATQYKAAPGSTFKIVTATAGLMEGVISLKDTINCVGTFKEITPSPRCWYIYGHGNENVVTAIRDSCNYFFYDVGYMLATRSGRYDDNSGLNTLYTYADMYGLSEKSGVEISEYSPDVSNLDSVRSAIGQGENSYTTAELARYTTTIANSGICYNLTLIDKVCDSSGRVLSEHDPDVRNTIEMPDSYWNAIHSGMRQVVEKKAYYSDLSINVAGKTGTAEQTRSRPNHALFIGYAPYEKPEIAFATRIPFGYSSDYAAQLTKEVIKYYYGLEEEDDIITGKSNVSETGITNEM